MSTVHPLASPTRLLVVMGVAGSGKTTVGVALSERLRVPYADADSFHSQASIAKMSAGIPLDDSDRWPWLRTIGAWLAGHRRDGGVVSCSALKRGYRDVLRESAPTVGFIHLHGDPEVVRRRMTDRPGHFMPPSLLESQFRTLEPLAPDELGLVLDLARPVDQLVDAALAAALRPPTQPAAPHRSPQPEPSTHPSPPTQSGLP